MARVGGWEATERMAHAALEGALLLLAQAQASTPALRLHRSEDEGLPSLRAFDGLAVPYPPRMPTLQQDQDPMNRAPVPTGRPPQTVDFKHKLIPIMADNPVLIQIEGVQGLTLACFSSEDNLSTFMTKSGGMYDQVLIIQDSAEFTNAIPPEVNLVLDPTVMPDGKLRYLHCVRS